MARRLLTVTAALGLLVVVVLVMLVVASVAVPVVVVVASAMLAIAVGVRSQLKGRPARKRTERGSRDERDVWPVAVAVRPEPLGPTWTTTWEALPLPSEIPAVRRHVAALLAEWNIGGDAAQPTLLVITELLSNAIEHGSVPIRLTLEWGHTFVRAQVQDSALGAPRATIPHSGAARGHGLQIVEGLALRRGWTPEQHGKTVWADVPTDWPA